MFLFLLMISGSTSVFSQVSATNVNSAGKFHEGLLICTDRDLYVAGEQVWMKIYKINTVTGAPADLSRILYAELLNDSDNPVVQAKIHADGASGSGWFILPDTLSSGNYLVRAYTKWMLNYPETDFSYKVISVLNPFKNLEKLLKPDARKGSRTTIPLQDNIRTESASVNNSPAVNIELDKSEYAFRERIRAGISVLDAEGNPVPADLSVSVIKSSLSDPIKMKLPSASINDPVNPSATSGPVRLPEPEGEIIRGTIRNKLTNEPLINADISFSIVGKSAECQFGHTNNRGEFLFIVRNLYGPKEIVVQPFLHDDAGCYVELEQEFSSTFSDLKPEMFYLDSARAEQINSAVISMQVNNMYIPYRQKHSGDVKPVEYNDFYGQPSRRVLISDYIELTNIREVIKEILPEVRIIRKYDKPWLKVNYENPFRKFEGQALVMVDGVPVTDIENLLEMQSKDFERIDMTNVMYFCSDFVFDGIVSFFTKRGNLNNLRFDESVFRQIFEGCQQSDEFYSPSYNIDSLRNSRVPDFRNTLYWNPSPSIDKAGKADIEFYASDEPGDYSVIVEGITGGGKSLFYSRKFRIK